MLLQSLRYYWRTQLIVVLGVAIAVAVLGGALLVGSSVRGSLREIATSRLGRTDVAVQAQVPFGDTLADRLPRDAFGPGSLVAPVLALDAIVVDEASGRTASGVQLFGIDERFAALQGVRWAPPDGRSVYLGDALASELGVAQDQDVLIRVAKPTDIPLATLQGRREQAGERFRMEIAAVLDGEALGAFSLRPAQGPVFTAFVPLQRLQRDLDLAARANMLLVGSQKHAADGPVDPAQVNAALGSALLLDDVGLRWREPPAGDAVVLESRAGLLSPGVLDAAERAAASLAIPSTRVLTYLANSLRLGERQIPYSLVASIEPSALGATSPPAPSPAPLWLNSWATDDLRAVPGDVVNLSYFLWSDQGGLTTHEAQFTVAGEVPMHTLGADPTLTPEYPGLTDAEDVTAWDPPFPVDLSIVRDKDEAYWDEFRAAPKAFTTLVAGQGLWASPYGNVSSLRLQRAAGVAFDPFRQRFESTLRQHLTPAASGIVARPVRAEALAAAEGTTDFGEYFVYFSFFLVAAALLLTYVFFALGLEQRTREIGLLSAVGYPPSVLRRQYLLEGAVLAGLGTVLGLAGALIYGWTVLYGLRTWWVGAVGTTALHLHVDWRVLIAGAALALAIAAFAIWYGCRQAVRRSPRALLGGAQPLLTNVNKASRARALVVTAGACFLLAAALLVLAGTGLLTDVAAFFASGGLLLLAGLLAVAGWLARRAGGGTLHHGSGIALLQLGMRQAAWRPTRSVLSLALVGFAGFVLVTVGAFRRDPAAISLARDAGTGGFALIGESVAPILYDPNTAEGRNELALDDETLTNGLRIARFRLRPGDDASCLTLYQPTNPRIIAPDARFISEGRFAFSASLADTPEEAANPWLLLNRQFPDGAVPAIVDATSMSYVLHLRLGEDLVLPAREGEPAPTRLRLVAALADSVLQSEVIIGEPHFGRLFPRHEGYRVWLIETPAGRAEATANWLEDRLSDFGFDVVDTRARLASYHEVENTYLATFEALGGLGLLIGIFGLSAVLARNVLERQRELGVLGAIGFARRDLRTLILAESGTLVVGGLALGTGAALVAIWPALAERVQTASFGYLAALLTIVAVAGLLSSVVAVQLVSRLSIPEAVKAE